MKCVTPRIDRFEAENLLAKRFIKKRMPEKVELIYLPYYCFEVSLRVRGDKDVKICVAVDGMGGSFSVLDSRCVNCADGGECKKLQFAIEKDVARNIALDSVRALMLSNALAHKKIVELKEIGAPMELAYPYWIGYFRRGKGIDFNAIDAVSGIKQGHGMKGAFLKLLGM